MVSNVLTGTLDVAIGISAELVKPIREQWGASSAGRVVTYPGTYRYVQYQLDAGRNRQPALFDARVRRAIVHAIDRDTIAQVTTDGLSPNAETMVSPNDPIFPRVDQAIAKYPFDPNRATAILQEAGWTRRGDTLVNGAGQPLTVDFWTTGGSASESEMASISDYLGRIGMPVNQMVIPPSRQRDAEYRVSFPGLNSTAFSIDVPANMVFATSGQCGSTQNHFAGQNRGCWLNSDYDSYFQKAITSFNPAERDEAIIQAWKVLNDEVPNFGMSFTPSTIPVKKGLLGPGVRWTGQLGQTFDVHTWGWE
jgi:peptide/nickel transport system substrate-binding protein